MRTIAKISVLCYNVINRVFTDPEEDKMHVALGVIYAAFCIWGIAANATAQPDKLENAPVRRWHQFVMGLTFVGALAYLGAPAFLYWIVFVLTVGFATAEDAAVKPLNWRRIGTTFGLLSVGFWLPALAYGFQPAPEWGALVLIVPAVLCTYVRPFRTWGQAGVDKFNHRVRETNELNDAALARANRHSWRSGS